VSGVAAGVERVGSVGIGSVASVLAGSGDTGRARVAGAVGAVPVLADAVSDGSDPALGEAVDASAGLRVDVKVDDAFEVVACTGVNGTLPVLAETESGDSVRAGVTATRGSTAGLRVGVGAGAGDELVAVGCAGIGVGVPDLGGAELGGGDLVGVTAARAPSAGLRLGPMTGIGPGVTVGVGPGALAGGVAGIGEETGRAACAGAIWIGVGGTETVAVVRFGVPVGLKSGCRSGVTAALALAARLVCSMGGARGVNRSAAGTESGI
jgi:hypothetical protein